MSIFTIWRTDKPVKDNEPQLVGQTPKLERAQDIADKLNKSELKAIGLDKLSVNGNRQITEIFTKEELKNVGFGQGGVIPK